MVVDPGPGPVVPLAGPTGPGPLSSHPSSHPSARTRWRAAATPVLVGAAAVGAVLLFDPVHRDVPLCPLHAVTGIWCPFCGGLRAVWLLAHLQVGAAAASNLVVFALVPWFAWRWWRGVTGRSPVVLRWRGRPVRPAVVTVAVVVLLVTYTVLRNLPVGQALAPAAA